MDQSNGKKNEFGKYNDIKLKDLICLQSIFTCDKLYKLIITKHAFESQAEWSELVRPTFHRPYKNLVIQMYYY